MPYDERIPLDLQLIRVGTGGRNDLGIFAYYISSQQTNFAVPSFCLAPADDDPDTMDVQGAIEGTLHAILDNGGTREDVERIMGLVQREALDPDTVGLDEYTDIDLGYCIDGSLLAFDRMEPETCDAGDVLSEQQMVNVEMAFDSLEPDDRLYAAERFATGDYTVWKAQEVCKAYREHLPREVIDAIADHRFKYGEMRALIGIAGITEPSPDGTGEPQRPAFRAVMEHLDEAMPKLHLIETLAETAHSNGVPFDERWCALDTEQVVSLRSAIAVQAPAEALEAFAGGRYSAASMDCITIAYCGGNDRMDASALLDPAYNPAQLWCLSSAVASHAQGDLSDAQLDFLRNPELPADLMNAVRNCFTYYGLSVGQAEQNVAPGTGPMQVYDLLDADIERPVAGEQAHDQTASALREEARVSREASGHLESDLPEDRAEVNQEKE